MPESSHEFTHHRPALLRVASDGFPMWLQAWLSPEDLVQHTLLEACQARKRIAELGDAAQMFGYLRAALMNNLRDAIRKFDPRRGDVSQNQVRESSRHINDLFRADQTSPSERAARAELLAKLRASLAALPDAQRVVVELRYLRGLRVVDIAGKLNRSVGAVSLLLHRAMAKLRNVLPDPND